MSEEEVLRIAVLGAGPVGLEATLYGRYLGYAVATFDDREVCAGLIGGEASLGKPFRDYYSTLALAALDAQDAAYQCPAPDRILSVHQWVTEYCLPLSKTDLVLNTLRIGSIVVSIEFDIDEEVFQVVSKCGEITTAETFDYVIDTRQARGFSEYLPAESVPPEHGPIEFVACHSVDYFVIGTRNRAFRYCDATDEICRVFATIGERDELNVYATLSSFRI